MAPPNLPNELSSLFHSLLPRRGIVDLNSDGFDDIWQLFYNAQGLTQNGNADNDGQGDIVWQNATARAQSG